MIGCTGILRLQKTQQSIEIIILLISFSVLMREPKSAHLKDETQRSPSFRRPHALVITSTLFRLTLALG